VANDKIEKLLWSIALPGFGQLLNHKYLKGILLITLEFLVNVQSNFNKVIILSFQGNILSAIKITNYQWLMFYPCLYFFAMWDAFKEAKEEAMPLSFLPFVFAAYFVTIGIIFSSKLKIFGMLFGPVFLPMLFLIPGLFTGLLISKVIKHTS